MNLRRMNLQRKKGLWGWVFIAPFVVGFLLIYSKVFVQSIIFSFQSFSSDEGGMVNTFVGWSNYKNIFLENADFNKTLLSSVSLSVFNVPVILILSLFVAVLLNQKMHGRAIFRAIFFIPVILSTGIIAQAEQSNRMVNTMMDISGAATGATGSGIISAMDIQAFLSQIKIGTEITGYVVSASNNIYNILNLSGVQILIFLAGLQSISPSVYESAKIEGATGWESFWKITFPMVKPLILLNLFYSLIDSFTNPQNGLITLIYNTGIKQGRFGIATAMAWSYTAIIAALVAVLIMIIGLFTFKQRRSERR